MTFPQTKRINKILTGDFEKTIINEIEHVGHFYTIKINKHKKTVETIKNNLNIFQVDINSRKGVDIIDKWHSRWFNLMKTFLREDQNLGINITGGRDSRASLSTVCFDSKIDIDTTHIRFNCLEWYDKEDLKISSEIGTKLGFQINKTSKPARKYLSTFLSLAYSFLTKMTIHNRITFNYFYYVDSYFYMGGDGGEFLRDHWLISPEIFISQFLHPKFPQYTNDIVYMLVESMSNINREYTSPHGPVHSVYECCRGKFHFGTCSMESFYTNYIAVTPLLDPLLSQLKLNSANQQNFDIILAVIYDRYLSLLSDIPFDRGHKISDSTYTLARNINKAFPIRENYQESKIKLSINKPHHSHLFPPQRPQPFEVLREIFYSENFKIITGKLLDKEIFKFCDKQFNNGLHLLKDILWLNDHVASLISIYLAFIAMQPHSEKRINNPLIHELVQLGTDED